MVDWGSVFGEFLMATHLVNLSAWASSLDAGELPPRVALRCRMQMLHVVTQMRAMAPAPAWRSAGPARGAARILGGGRTNVVTAARVHAVRAAASDKLDFILGGPTGLGGVCAVLACSKGRTMADMVAAVAAANEVAGRIGSAMSLGPHHGAGNGWVHSASAAVAAARMMGLDAERTAHALAIALAGGGPVPRATLASSSRSTAVGLAVGRGVEAALLASKGVQGQLDLLECSGGLLEAGCWLPLHQALTGLGVAWLTETVCFPRWPGPVAWHAALDCVDEILSRHVKAADKRLRADQVLDITVSVPAPAIALDRWVVRHGRPDAAGMAHSIRHTIGALVAHHELQIPAELEDERCGLVAGKVRVEHDLKLTMDFVAHALDTVLPLIGGITEGEWKRLAGRFEAPESGWPSIGWKDIRTLAQHRPDKWLQRIRYAPRDLSEGRISEWQWRLGAAVEVRTTRGGCWPADRPIASGGPGDAWEPLVERVVGAFAQGDPPAEADAWALLEMATAADSAEVMDCLLD